MALQFVNYVHRLVFQRSLPKHSCYYSSQRI